MHGEPMGAVGRGGAGGEDIFFFFFFKIFTHSLPLAGCTVTVCSR